jgi:hypothetical protein
MLILHGIISLGFGQSNTSTAPDDDFPSSQEPYQNRLDYTSGVFLHQPTSGFPRAQTHATVFASNTLSSKFGPSGAQYTHHTPPFSSPPSSAPSTTPQYSTLTAVCHSFIAVDRKITPSSCPRLGEFAPILVTFCLQLGQTHSRASEHSGDGIDSPLA